MLSTIIVSRNDNYGSNLYQRSKFCLQNALLMSDEVIYIDWKPLNNVSLIDELREDLPKTGKLRHIRVEKEFIKEHLNEFYNYPIIEVVGRNIGIRRAKYDFILSTNIDIIFDRPNISTYTNDAFYVGRRQDISTYIYQSSKSLDELRNIIKSNSFSKKPYAIINNEPIHDKNDTWTPVVCCGDFQLAHKNVWYNIKGFEELLKGRCYADGNIFKKVILQQYKIIVDEEINAYHLNHEEFNYPPLKEQNEHLPHNSYDTYLKLENSTNLDNWGFSNIELKEEII